MTSLKKIIAALGVIGFAAASSVALAGSTPVSLNSTGPLSWSGTFGITNITSPSFADDWTFMLPAGSAGQASASAFASFSTTTYAPTVVFTSAEFWDLTTKTSVSMAPVAPYPTIFSANFTLPLSLNTSDTYALRLKGNTLGSSGSYAGTLNVTAVPEPESYALFLAGLGLMGFIARRRTSV